MRDQSKIFTMLKKPKLFKDTGYLMFNIFIEVLKYISINAVTIWSYRLRSKYSSGLPRVFESKYLVGLLKTVHFRSMRLAAVGIRLGMSLYRFYFIVKPLSISLSALNMRMTYPVDRLILFDHIVIYHTF